MDKRRLHHLWTQIRPIKVWYLIVLCLLASAVSIAALRQNNLTMIALRKAVYEADEKGGDVEAALRDLRSYVHAHMNTSLASGSNAVYPPIQLKYTYQRLQQAEKERVKQDTARVYTDAQNACERQHPTGYSGSGRIPCIERYVTQHQAAEKTVPDALYKFDFIPPKWSPDVAGFSLITTGMLFVLLVLRILTGRLFKVLD